MEEMQPVIVTLQESSKREKCCVDKYLRRYRNAGLMQYFGKNNPVGFSCSFVDDSLMKKYF